MPSRAEIFGISAREGIGLEPWFDRILGRPVERTGPAELDYIQYGQGEALLGWLNGVIEIQGSSIDGNAVLLDFATRVQERLASDGVEIAHLKATLAADEMANDLGVVNLVASDRTPELSHALIEPLDRGELVINLRAEAAPDLLKRGVIEIAESRGRPGAPVLHVVHLECFSPAQPTPTYRLAND